MPSTPKDRLARELAAIWTGWRRGTVTAAKREARRSQVIAQAAAAGIIRERSAHRRRAERSRRGGER